MSSCDVVGSSGNLSVTGRSPTFFRIRGGVTVGEAGAIPSFEFLWAWSRPVWNKEREVGKSVCAWSGAVLG